MSVRKIEFKKHSKDFIDTLIIYCDSFYSVYKNTMPLMNKKQMNTNSKDFIKTIIDLYEIEE